MKKFIFLSLSFLFLFLMLGCGGGYRISVTATGFDLTYSGTVVLQNNGSDDLTITENGTFSFTGKLANNADYAVTVSSRPSLQSCSLGNATGTVSKVNVEVTLTCEDKSWTHPAALADHISPSDDKVYNIYDAAMDDEGNTIVVWMQTSSAWKDQIYISEYRDGTWTHPAIDEFFSTAGENAKNARVAMDNNGNAIVVWLQQLSGGGNWMVFMRKYTAGEGWSAKPELSADGAFSPTGADAMEPQVAMDNEGNAIIAWVQDNSVADDTIYMRSCTPEGGWSAKPDRAVANDSFSPVGVCAFADTPQIAVKSGNAVISWIQYSNTLTKDMLYARYKTSGGSWDAKPDLTSSSAPLSPTGDNAQNSWLSMNSEGDALVAWVQPSSDTAFSQVFIAEYMEGSWSKPADRADYISAGLGNVSKPRTAYDDSGNRMLIWCEHDGTNTRIFKLEHSSSSWGSSPSIAADAISPGGGDACGYDPDLAMDNNGNAIVVWDEEVSSYTNIYMSEYKLGVWSHPTGTGNFINPGNGKAYDPRVAMSDNGDAIIAWMQNNGTNNQIYLSEFR